jgi:hypothetical protein
LVLSLTPDAGRTVDFRRKPVKNERRMLRVALVAIALAACGSDPLSNVCSTPTVCGSSTAGYRLCTRQAGTEAFYLACANRDQCTSEPQGTVFECVSPSDCADARRQAIDWCAQQP